MNFCIFQRHTTEYEDGVLMLGWLSKGALGYQHKTIITDHPALVQIFTEYFDRLSEDAQPYQPALPPAIHTPPPLKQHDPGRHGNI